jgi:hypothetical protein
MESKNYATAEAAIKDLKDGYNRKKPIFFANVFFLVGI